MANKILDILIKLYTVDPKMANKGLDIITIQICIAETEYYILKLNKIHVGIQTLKRHKIEHEFRGNVA